VLCAQNTSAIDSRKSLSTGTFIPFQSTKSQIKGGRVMYYMIHASDHDDAPKLMNRAYGKALDIKESDEQLELLRDALSRQQ